MATAKWGSCTLEECGIQRSIFKYRPSLTTNSAFIALFGLSLVVHGFQGAKYRQYVFAVLMILGCACEMIGYGGRLIMYDDPWSFTGFIVQVVCITIAPVFLTAAVYITLHKSIMKLSPTSARFRPSLYYQVFIPCDIISLVLQSVGGAMSTRSGGSSQMGVDIGLAGLSFQVFTLLAFICLAIDYGMRYSKNDDDAEDASEENKPTGGLDVKFKAFLCFLSLATLVIFVRCAYRIYELSDGYRGAALHNEPLFVGLEGCMIVVAVFALNICHPGPVFRHAKSEEEPEEKSEKKLEESGSESATD